MSSPDTTREYGENELPEDIEHPYEEVAKDGAYHWGKIKEIASALELQAKDLQDLLNNFQQNPLFPPLK